MKKLICALGLASLSIGCATVPANLHAPSTIVALVSEPKPTGWWRDYCQGGVLVQQVPECVQIGGQVLRVKLTNIRTLGGEPIEGTAVIGLPGPQYVPSYQGEKEIQLRTSPSEFFEATGLEFIASAWKDT